MFKTSKLKDFRQNDPQMEKVKKSSFISPKFGQLTLIWQEMDLTNETHNW